jgi:hypothetical protein
MGPLTSQKWTPNVDAGTQIVFQVSDANNINVTSGPVTVQVRRECFSCVPLVVTGSLNFFLGMHDASVLGEPG